MNPVCRRLQDRLAETGPRTLRDDEAAQGHVLHCASCFGFLETVAELDSSLRSLPRHDAPDDVVERLLRREASLGKRPAPRAARFAPLAWGSAIAASLLLAFWLGGFVTDVPMEPASPRRMSSQTVTPPQAVAQEKPAPQKARDTRMRKPAARPSFTDIDALIIPAQDDAGAASPAPAPIAKMPAATSGESGMAIRLFDTRDGTPLPGASVVLSSTAGSAPPMTELTDVNGAAEFRNLPSGSGYVVEASSPGYAKVRLADRSVESGSTKVVPIGMTEAIQEKVEVVGQREVVDLERGETSTRLSDEFIRDLPVPGRLYQNVLTQAPGVSDDDGDGNRNASGARSRDFKAIVGGASNVDPFSGESLGYANPDSIEEIEVITAGAGVEYGRGQGGFANVSVSPASATARAFLEERSSLAGVRFIEAKGYWANTYVPGDPALRLLEARLAGRPHPALTASSAIPERLHDASRQNSQPFDPPTDVALAVHLHADRRGLEGPGRLLVQVGLKGTRRHAGRRPPMNLGVVLDLRGEVPIDVATGMRALVRALGQAKGPGDRFSLVVAGRTGGVVVGPASFRHGPLMVALDRLLGDEAAPGQSLGIEDAVMKAIEAVASVDEPTSPLGASAVLLVTGQTLGSSTDSVMDLAHQSAILGVPVSVVGIGSGVVPMEIERLSLAGQGNRRLLAGPSEAQGLVDRELSAVSRAVARAVRLRIRLAPSVKLIGVLGSETLDQTRTRRVREAERSIDRRVARSLGIEADRGEDEEGIQIFIPNFYAEDAHVVLLDVAAPGPGSIADVQVRYKDLVRMRNAVARSALRLGRDTAPAGPLERNVLQNVLALRLSDTLDRAGTALASGDRARAASLLGGLRVLLTGLCAEVPGLEGDPDVSGDLDMLGEYLTLLESGTLRSGTDVAYLSDSLRYAARLKLLPRPVVDWRSDTEAAP